jgi:hypothetical protein
MSTPILDPTLPADNAPIVSGELRGQFQAIDSSLADIRARIIAVTRLPRSSGFGRQESFFKMDRARNSLTSRCRGTGCAMCVRGF